MTEFTVETASKDHLHLVDQICQQIEDSARKRGTGIAKRSPEYIRDKILEDKAIVAVTEEKKLAGFCYIETWSNHNYVANSGLIVVEDYREKGLARKIKKQAFLQSRKLFPNASLFGLTTSLAVMKINCDLGYQPVTFSELTADDDFWKGCQSCVNYDVLERTDRKHCLCTGMLFKPPGINKTNQIKTGVAGDLPIQTGETTISHTRFQS